MRPSKCSAAPTTCSHALRQAKLYQASPSSRVRQQQQQLALQRVALQEEQEDSLVGSLAPDSQEGSRMDSPAGSRVLLVQGLRVRVVSGTTMRTCLLGPIRTARMQGRGRLGGSECKCVGGLMGGGGMKAVHVVQLSQLYSVVVGGVGGVMGSWQCLLERGWMRLPSKSCSSCGVYGSCCISVCCFAPEQCTGVACAVCFLQSCVQW
jgi:hypothetical protein